MKKETKIRLMQNLSTHLLNFRPDLINSFLCPVCLVPFPSSELHNISVAHIIPKNVSGTLTTFLCTKCNSTFGTNQDKWFGEYIKVSNSDKHFKFASGETRTYFTLNGQRVNGWYEYDNVEGFKFYQDLARNSPKVNQAIEEMFRSNPDRFTIAPFIPVIDKEDLIKIGFLTAGYLAWFHTLGYSWVLQSHLQPIREIIKNPEMGLKLPEFFFHCGEFNFDPWIGLVPLNGNVFPAFGYNRHLVIFPPFYNPELWKNIDSIKSTMHSKDVRVIAFQDGEYRYSPVITIYENKRVTWFDSVPAITSKTKAIYFNKSEPSLQMMYFTDPKVIKDKKKSGEVKVTRIETKSEKSSPI